MSAAATLASPQLNPQHLPAQPLYGAPAAEANAIGWPLAPNPYTLPAPVAHALPQLGQALWAYQWACEQLYVDSLTGKRNVPGWIADLLNQGKPPALVKFATMKRFKRDVPRVLRPDLLITDDSFAITELDSVPGGLGFISALNQAYRQSGFTVLEAEQTLPLAWWETVTHGWQPRAEATEPTVAVVVSEESQDYLAELTWLAVHLQTVHGKAVFVVRPKQIRLVREQLVFTADDGEETPIDCLYRFFELFDLPNIPNAELMQFAVKKGWVTATPPFKPHLEEKLWLALLHHPVLANHWQALLGKHFEFLRAHVPQGWVLDPAKLPPQAIIPGLYSGEIPAQSFQQLATATQKERELVLKPSGFSPLAWGSRGVVVGHDVNSDDWTAALNNALTAFSHNPHILQRYHKPAKHTAEQLDLATGQTHPFAARTRLCPYFLAKPDAMDPKQAEITLGGVLATHCPADKKIIHGMTDAIMAPCNT